MYVRILRNISWGSYATILQLRMYVWLEYWDYCVILERWDQQQGQLAWLITAFRVDGPSRKRNLQRKFESREL